MIVITIALRSRLMIVTGARLDYTCLWSGVCARHVRAVTSELRRRELQQLHPAVSRVLACPASSVAPRNSPPRRNPRLRRAIRPNWKNIRRRKVSEWATGERERGIERKRGTRARDIHLRLMKKSSLLRVGAAVPTIPQPPSALPRNSPPFLNYRSSSSRAQWHNGGPLPPVKVRR